MTIQYLLYEMAKSTYLGGQNECRSPAIVNVVVHKAPIVSYYSLRLATCLPAIVASWLYGDTTAPLLSWAGVGAIVIALCIVVGSAYGYVWRSDGISRLGKPDIHPRLWTVRSIGAFDFTCTLLIVFLSGGWGSTF